MSLWLEGLTVLLVASLALGLIRIWRGPCFADRMLAAQLLGTSGVAALLLLAELLQMPALRDVALVLALLAILAVLAFVARVWDPDDRDTPATEADDDRA
jgi:multicomponent Na+:H+ antiporter subunit F